MDTPIILTLIMSKNEKKRSPSKAELKEKKPATAPPLRSLNANVDALQLHPSDNVPPFRYGDAQVPSVTYGNSNQGGNFSLPPFVNDGNNVGNTNKGGEAHLLPIFDINNFAISPFDGGATTLYPPQYGGAPPLLPPVGNVHAGGALPLLPPVGNVHAGGALPLLPPVGNVHAGGAANVGFASSYPPIGKNDGASLNYCGNNGSDIKNCDEDRMFDDDDDDVTGGHIRPGRARTLATNFRERISYGSTGLDMLKKFLMNYVDRGDKSPLCFYVGWKEDETVGEKYSHDVFWIKYTAGDKIYEKVHDCLSSQSFADISLKKVSNFDPHFEARDHLKMYWVHYVNNPPQFDHREALRKHAKAMQTGDYVVLTLNHSDSDDSVENYKVTDCRNKHHKDAVNGNTYKVFHLKGSVGKSLSYLLGKVNIKLKYAGRDGGGANGATVYSIYTKV
eukprot:scaffold10409_cov135-Skeletonema_dohrnii-CCMP3373.AAC.5